MLQSRERVERASLESRGVREEVWRTPPPQNSWNNMPMSYEDYQTLWEYSAEHKVLDRPSSSGDRALESQSRSSGFEPRLRQSFSRLQEGNTKGIVVEAEAPRVVPVEDSLGVGAQDQQAGQSGSETHSQQCFSCRTGQREPPSPTPLPGDERGEG